MSTWRRKAMESFYDMRLDFQYKEDTIYTLFFALLPRVVEAHENNDTEMLREIYGYAEWCINQKAKDLWNAAGVAFYEHLVDKRITAEAIPYWIKPEVFEEVKGLFKARLEIDTYNQMLKNFNDVNGTNIQ